MFTPVRCLRRAATISLLGRRRFSAAATFLGADGVEYPTPSLQWIKPAANPFGVPLLDCRPITSVMVSSSDDPKCTANAWSYEKDGSGECFLDDYRAIQKEIAETGKFGGQNWIRGDCQLRFRRDRYFAAGALHTPRAMEDKWFISHHESKIFFVRSWLRKLELVAHVKQSPKPLAATAAADSDYVDIVGWEGFVSPSLVPRVERVIDVLLRNIVCGDDYPAPLSIPHDTPADLVANYETTIDRTSAGLSAWSYYGRAVNFCTPAVIEPRPIPRRPLRSYSNAFFALRGFRYAEFDKIVAAGQPVDLCEQNGANLLSIFALGSQRVGPSRSVTATAEHLLKSGHPIDARNSEGGTALMNAAIGSMHIGVDEPEPTAVAAAKAKGEKPPAGTLKPPPVNNGGEYSHITHMKLLIKSGADVNAKDAHGFTPLHCAAACADATAMQVLIDAGAVVDSRETLRERIIALRARFQNS